MLSPETRRWRWRLLSAVLVLSPLLASGPGPPANAEQASQGQAARDGLAGKGQPKGTAVLTGRVVALDSGRAIRRARVIASGPGGARVVVTDNAGRFEIVGLPAGSFLLTASKSGFLAASYGQRSWPGSGAPVALAEAQRAGPVDIVLPRGGVITGRVLDEDGEPFVRATVRVARLVWLNGEARAAAGGSDTTDDRGQFRVFGLAPGTYYVSAVCASETDERLPASTGVEPASPTSTAYAPMYHPSATSIAEAGAVRVNAGEEATGIDITLRAVSVAEVSGSVMTPVPSARAAVSLVPDGELGFAPSTFEATVSRDGTFRIRDVPPGRYLVFAREIGGSGRGTGEMSPALRFAVQPVVVAGQKVEGLTLALTRGGSVSGTVSFETERLRPPTDLGAFRIVTTGARASLGIPAAAAQVRPDGTFTITNVPPVPVLVDAAVPGRSADGSPGSSWHLKGIYLNGQDISDTPLEVAVGHAVSGVLVLFSDSVSGLTGNVRDKDGHPVAACPVAAFSADAALWRAPQSRYLRLARTDGDGRFQIRPLPPGRYYVLALTDLDPLQWTNPDVLDRLRSSASVVTLSERETKALNLVLAAR